MSLPFRLNWDWRNIILTEDASSDKARKLGWHGFVDSSESFLEVFEDLAKLKMIPPVPKVEVKFL